MSWWSEQLKSLIAATDGPGEELAPAQLLATSLSLGTPLAALVSREGSDSLFHALNDDLGFVFPIRHSGQALSDEHTRKLAGSLRWLIDGLCSWRVTDDQKGVKLAALMVVAARLDEEGALWEALPSKISGNPDLAKGLVHVLSNLNINFEMGFTRSPISDGETLDEIQIAEAEKDWARLRQVAEDLCYSQMIPVFVSQSVRLLQRFFPNDLVAYAGTVSQVAMAMEIVTVLPIEAALDIATRSKSDVLEFASVCRLFNQYTRVTVLTSAEEDALVTLLIQAAADAPRWTRWMKAFVAHPYRASQMQAALGRCLASGDPTAMTDYLDALVLQANFLGREEVGACLLAFAQNTPLARRQEVWRQAFERWSNWNYGEGQKNTIHNEISLSNLDFAIVAYSMECQTEEERNAFIADCLDKVGRAEHTWYSSQGVFQEYLYRTLSRIQPFAHAQSSTSDPNTWLWNKNGGCFCHLLNEPFWRLRFHLRKYDDYAARNS
ncbi:hypothetical protein [Parvibaculum sp.]|uniref:hypothetical protein n=1 Tax=Parvibaculum sp. TaxID=2024848 RepID=UPI001DBC654E|nr:hypothetical protein [Parvibaculum sp.]MBX3488720.1 hypothetical protein [Parvibaculum sp.]MCW5727398.1 hypothetical protein [Parvibaculum sp.]